MKIKDVDFFDELKNLFNNFGQRYCVNFRRGRYQKAFNVIRLYDVGCLLVITIPVYFTSDESTSHSFQLYKGLFINMSI